ncbi:MAG: FtsW/RodA/SpoVE family cell cycle protein [Acidimicrobiia bacterium]
MSTSAIGRRRRNIELGLILMAVAITAGLYVLGALGKTATIPANIGPFLVIVLALLLVAHVATRRLAPGADSSLLPVAALLNGIGYVFIARLDEELAAAQATWTFIGIAMFVATLVVLRRVRDLQRLQWTFALAGLALVVLPLIPGVGRTINGSRIWVAFGPISFQPGEFAKIALALFFAGYLVERREMLSVAMGRFGPIAVPEGRHLLPVLLAWGFSILVMVYQADLGSSLLFFTLFVVMLWVATERSAYLGVGAIMFSGGAYFAFKTFSRVQTRVDVWIDPWSRAQGKGYQIVQAAFAMAWGGVTGTGIGLGDPNRVPFAYNDFIFSTIGEELGMLGSTAILAAYVIMIGAGLRIALKAERPFEKLLATGLTTILGVQAFIIIAGVIRVLPLTGVTLPFVSYGGSSLLANYLLLAILIRLSHDAAERAGEVPHPTPRVPRSVRRAAEAGAA